MEGVKVLRPRSIEDVLKNLDEIVESYRRIFAANMSFIGTERLGVPSLVDLLHAVTYGRERMVAVGFVDNPSLLENVSMDYRKLDLFLITRWNNCSINVGNWIREAIRYVDYGRRVIGKLFIGENNYLIIINSGKLEISVATDNNSGLSSKDKIITVTFGKRIDATPNTGRDDIKYHLENLVRYFGVEYEEKIGRTARNFVKGLLDYKIPSFENNIKIFPISFGAYVYIMMILNKLDVDAMLVNHYSTLPKTMPILKEISRIVPVYVIPSVGMKVNDKRINAGSVPYWKISEVLGDNYLEKLQGSKKLLVYNYDRGLGGQPVIIYEVK